MGYNENEFKEKANRKARGIWIIFAVLLCANYGDDVSRGDYSGLNYVIFLLLCWVPILSGEILLRVKDGRRISTAKTLRLDTASFIPLLSAQHLRPLRLLTYFRSQVFLSSTKTKRS